MGFSSSWFAVRGVSREDLLTALSCGPSGRRADHPDFRLCIAALPQDWQLVWLDRDLEQAFRDITALSAATAGVACAIEEHVMVSEARGYANGAEVWRVIHDPEAGESIYHFEAKGTPPPQLVGILATAKAEQAAEGGEDADIDLIFDVPTNLAKSLCGFKHDEEPADGVVFEELRRVKGKGGGGKPGFFARLFGRG